MGQNDDDVVPYMEDVPVYVEMLAFRSIQLKGKPSFLDLKALPSDSKKISTTSVQEGKAKLS